MKLNKLIRREMFRNRLKRRKSKAAKSQGVAQNKDVDSKQQTKEQTEEKERKEYWVSSSDFWSQVWSNQTEKNDITTRNFFASITLESWLKDNGFQSLMQPLEKTLNIKSIDHLNSVEEKGINNFLLGITNDIADYTQKSNFKREFLKLASKYQNFQQRQLNMSTSLYGVHTIVDENSPKFRNIAAYDSMLDRYSVNLLSFGVLRNNGINPTDVATIVEKYIGYNQFYIKNNHQTDCIVFENPNHKILSFKVISDDNDDDDDIDINDKYNLQSKKFYMNTNCSRFNMNKILVEIGVIGLKKIKVHSNKNNSKPSSIQESRFRSIEYETLSVDEDAFKIKKQVFFNQLRKISNRRVEDCCSLENILQRFEYGKIDKENIHGYRSPYELYYDDIHIRFLQLEKRQTFDNKDEWMANIVAGINKIVKVPIVSDDNDNDNQESKNRNEMIETIFQKNTAHNLYHSMVVLKADNNKREARNYCIKPNDCIIMFIDVNNNKNLLSFYKSNMIRLLGRGKSASWSDHSLKMKFNNGYWTLDANYQYFPCFATRGCNCDKGTACQIRVVSESEQY